MLATRIIIQMLPAKTTSHFCKHIFKEHTMNYYLSLTQNNPGSNHEVHREECEKCPSTTSRIDLGYCSSSYVTFYRAKQYFRDVDGCALCCPEIHYE